MIPGQQAQPPVEFGGGEGTRPGMPAQAPGFDYGKFAQMIGPSDPGMAMQALEKLKPKEKTLKDTKTLMRNGQRVTVNFYTDGSHEVVPFDPDLEKAHFASTGQRVGVPLDPFTGAVRGQGLQATLAPGDAARAGAENAKAQAMAAQAAAMEKVGGGEASRKLGDLVATMRKEYAALESVKNFKSAAPIAMAAGNAPDTPAGDLDLIYAVGKVLDPGSVVREGELNLVIKSGSPVQRFEGYARMIAQGKGRLPPAQRAQLMEMLKGRVSQLKSAHDREAAPFVEQAKRMQLPMAEIFGGGGTEPGTVLKFDAQGNPVP